MNKVTESKNLSLYNIQLSRTLVHTNTRLNTKNKSFFNKPENISVAEITYINVSNKTAAEKKFRNNMKLIKIVNSLLAINAKFNIYS